MIADKERGLQHNMCVRT